MLFVAADYSRKTALAVVSQIATGVDDRTPGTSQEAAPDVLHVLQRLGALLPVLVYSAAARPESATACKDHQYELVFASGLSAEPVSAFVEALTIDLACSGAIAPSSPDVVAFCQAEHEALVLKPTAVPFLHGVQRFVVAAASCQLLVLASIGPC